MAKKRGVSGKAAPAAKVSIRFDTLFVLQCVVAVFLVTLGLMALLEYDSDWSRFARGVNRFFGKANDPLAVMVAVVEIVAGALVLAALFVPVRKRWLFWTTLAVGIAWIAQIVLVRFVPGDFEPFLAWLNGLAGDLVVLGVLWLINRKYA
jgi:uncharacterized membrane protein YphA (DoxX/SURF4 family)